MQHTDTICAIATAPGRGGVGIVRISGPKSLSIAKTILGFSPKPRHAHFSDFTADSNVLDQGISLFFKGPNSFTGEDVFEFQGHGGPVVLDMMIDAIVQLGARVANPGEFSERAFLNDKLDLTQAEAIADLIDASSKQAAKQALNSLKGVFAKKIDALVIELTELRIFVESAIDFPEEEIDFLADQNLIDRIDSLLKNLKLILKEAEQGSLMREGMRVVLAGRPNAGKSTLLNALAGNEVAIVTDIAGTTRDLVKEHIQIDGMPLHITDTAGIREADNEVERIGIDRAWHAVNDSDRILLILDATQEEQLNYEEHWPEFFNEPRYADKLTLVLNKVDLVDESTLLKEYNTLDYVKISAKEDIGLNGLKTHLKDCMGLQQNTEGAFSARRRHVEALQLALELVETGYKQLRLQAAGELMAEDLRQAQDVLGTITGKLSPDELLGKIFSSFCIGK
ncbi:MAG: tRNA modification GTPase [Flavobacteriales bacterium]